MTTLNETIIRLIEAAHRGSELLDGCPDDDVAAKASTELSEAAAAVDAILLGSARNSASNPLEILSRAPAGMVRADELIFAWQAVQELVEAAGAGHPMRGAGEAGAGLWFNAEKAVRLRAALTKFGGAA